MTAMFVNRSAQNEQSYRTRRSSIKICGDIVAVSFIGGGNRSTRRKLQTCRKSLTNNISFSYNVVSSTPRLGGIQTHNFSGDKH